MRRDFAGHPGHAKLVSSSAKTPNKRLRSIPPVASPEDPCSLHCELTMGTSRHHACRYPSRTLVYGCWKTAQKHATLRHIPRHLARLPDGKQQSVSRFVVIRYDLRFASPSQRENLWRKRPGNGHIRQGVLFSIVSSGKRGWPLRWARLARLTTQDCAPQRRRRKAGKSLNHRELGDHGEKKTEYVKMMDDDQLKRTIDSPVIERIGRRRIRMNTGLGARLTSLRARCDLCGSMHLCSFVFPCLTSRSLAVP
jgi:hypothetical protein